MTQERYKTARGLPRPRARRAIVLADATVALLIVSLMAVTFLTSIGRQRRASDALARQRAAYRLAESVMTGLQSGRTHQRDAATRGGDESSGIGPEEMTPTVTPAGGAAPAGFEWVTVTVGQGASDDNGRKKPKTLASLTGLVPRRPPVTDEADGRAR